jgi:hypothetical protein
MKGKLEIPRRKEARQHLQRDLSIGGFHYDRGLNCIFPLRLSERIHQVSICMFSYSHLFTDSVFQSVLKAQYFP